MLTPLSAVEKLSLVILSRIRLYLSLDNLVKRILFKGINQLILTRHFMAVNDGQPSQNIER